jgi:hypothetical protein
MFAGIWDQLHTPILRNTYKIACYMCEKVSITHGLGYKLYPTPSDSNFIISQPLQASVYLNPMDVR